MDDEGKSRREDDRYAVGRAPGARDESPDHGGLGQGVHDVVQHQHVHGSARMHARICACVRALHLLVNQVVDHLAALLDGVRRHRHHGRIRRIRERPAPGVRMRVDALGTRVEAEDRQLRNALLLLLLLLLLKTAGELHRDGGPPRHVLPDDEAADGHPPGGQLLGDVHSGQRRARFVFRMRRMRRMRRIHDPRRARCVVLAASSDARARPWWCALRPQRRRAHAHARAHQMFSYIHPLFT